MIMGAKVRTPKYWKAWGLWLVELTICQTVPLDHPKMNPLKGRILVSKAAVDKLGEGKGVEEGHPGARGGKIRRKSSKENQIEQSLEYYSNMV